jgi:hypothetical protein
MEAVQLAALGEDLEHHQRRADRHRAADDDGARRGQPHQQGDQRPDRGDDHDLHDRPRDHDAPHPRQVPERELDAQREQQQDDPQLRQLRDPFRVAHEAGVNGR